MGDKGDFGIDVTEIFLGKSADIHFEAERTAFVELSGCIAEDTSCGVGPVAADGIEDE